MTKSLALTVIALALTTAGAAYAGNDRNPTNARAMADFIKANDPGFASIANTVSGNRVDDRNLSGWGNTGSKLAPGGGQVSAPKK